MADPHPSDAGRPDAAHVLVTRAEPGASQTAKRLQMVGWSPLLTPALRVVPRPVNPDVERGVQAVILTSANAARRLPAPPPQAAPIFAVGPATADAARAAGRTDVLTAGPTALALARAIAARCAPHAGPLLFLRGAHVARDLAGTLRAAGFAVREAVAYEAAPTAGLTPEAAGALQAGATAAVLVHSARGCAAFCDQVEAAGLAPACQRVALAGLSAAALAPADRLVFAARQAAARPDDDALLQTLTDMGLRRD